MILSDFLYDLFHRFLILLYPFQFFVDPVPYQYHYLQGGYFPWVLEHCSNLIMLGFLSDIFHQFLILLDSFNLLVFIVSDIFQKIYCFQTYISYLFLLASLSTVNVYLSFSEIFSICRHHYLSYIFHQNLCQCNSGKSIFPISMSCHHSLSNLFHNNICKYNSKNSLFPISKLHYCQLIFLIYLYLFFLTGHPLSSFSL